MEQCFQNPDKKYFLRLAKLAFFLKEAQVCTLVKQDVYLRKRKLTVKNSEE